MEDESLRKLYTSLAQGPTFLFLGQDYLRLETGTDPYLSEVLEKYGRGNSEAPSYDDLLDGEAQKSVEDSLAWMHKRSERLSIPEWLKTVAGLSWNGVYTSAIDTVWPKAFYSEWRELQPIFDDRDYFSNPRNSFQLHCTFLFGRVDRDDASERVPLSKREWRKREQVAFAFARRLPELISPLGLLLIEGYSAKHDWFHFEDLLSIVVDELGPGQTHVFSVREELDGDPYAKSLIEEGKLTLHRESLAAFFTRGKELGVLQLGQRPETQTHGRQIRIEDNAFVMPTALWNQVARSAIVLDDTVLLPVDPLSADARYREFRRFLSESGSIPVWPAYTRGLAFCRDFERVLRDKVNKRLKDKKTLLNEPILLHGQTGTGKSVALGHLAYDIRKEGLFAVLYIRDNKPINSDIDAFCIWLKDQWEGAGKPGAPTTLIVWDANEIDQYYQLLLYLAGRGHRVVLVGSSYKQQAVKRTKRPFVEVEAPARLTNSEIDRFIDFLNGFEPSLGVELRRHVTMSDNSFLVALYRWLPATRSLIKAGVIREYDKAERDLKRIADADPSLSTEESGIYRNTLYYSMVKAGLIDDKDRISTLSERIAGAEASEAQQIMGLVLVPGSLGLSVPFDLLLRSLSKSETRVYTDLLSTFDIFSWHQDALGNITIGPRQSLEARLWARASLGGAKYEIDYVRKLLLAVKDTGSLYANPEVQFAVDLVRRMGPNNAEGSRRFEFYLRDLAETLGELRQRRGVEHPRLMLQEATLLREYVRRQSQEAEPPQDAEQILEEAEEVLNAALELVSNERRTRSVFLVELASVLGTRFLHSLKQGAVPEDAKKLFERSRDAALQAWSADTENYIPIDVLSWTTRDLLQSDAMKLDPEYRFEAEADILHVFEMAESEEFGAVHDGHFQERRFQIGQAIGKEELSSDAFEKLRELGSAAGYYLRAHSMVHRIPLDRELRPEQRARCAEAAEYLEQNRDAIHEDGRSLYLLLRLWWISKTGKPMFFGERQSLPFEEEDWLYYLHIINSLTSLDQVYRNAKLSYLQAIAAFHLDDFMSSSEIFKQLERDSDYMAGPRRIIRSYLASLPDGAPRIFNGEVRWLNADGSKGTIFVPALRQVIPFFPRDFNRPNIEKGEAISEFHIAFNYLGPLADPVSLLKLPGSRRRIGR